MRHVAVLVVVVLAACASKTGIAVTVPMAPPSELAKIKRFQIRTITMGALYANSPEQKASWPEGVEMPDDTEYYEAALNTARRVLEEKGYEVEIVWDHPYSYGSDRPCIGPKPGDHACTPDELEAHTCKPEPWYQQCKREYPNGFHGYFIHMASYGGLLAPDMAFLELVTTSSVQDWTTTTKTSGEQQVGRITDENGNTTGRLYENTTNTNVEAHHREFSSASVQIFVADRKRPIYDAQAWSEKSANLVYVTQDVLAKIPPRAK